MKLPIGHNLGSVPVVDAIAYGQQEVIINPKHSKVVMYVDIEKPHESHIHMKGTQLHLGVKADFKIKRKYSNNTPRIDIYLPLSAMPALIKILVNLDKAQKRL